MDVGSTVLEAALAYAALGWPVFPCKPRAKEPATRHGVKDATTDVEQIHKWFDRDHELNIGIACGAPGPQVLDIDDLVKGKAALLSASRLNGPDVATARGRQFYFLGTSAGTISLGYGELRGHGSYVVAPPSIHPTGKLYAWIVEPTGLALPRLPDGIVPASASTAGTGTYDPPPALVGLGERHDALKDHAVRLVRGGYVDVPTIEFMLRMWFEAHCDPNPPAKPDEFRKLAVWAAKTNIAARERTFADHVAGERPKGRKVKEPTGLETPPRGDAPLNEHRAYVGIAGGWGNRIDIASVRRGGPHLGDWMEIRLTNGQVIYFERQEHVVSRAGWVKQIVSATNGIAEPVTLNELDGGKVFRSLCILADAPLVVSQAEGLRDTLEDFIALCEALTDHDLSTSGGRYDVIARCRARNQWDPFHDSDERHPVLIVDRADLRHYLRAGELRAWLSHEGYRIDSSLLAGRMGLIGCDHVELHGREAPRMDDKVRRTNRMVAYRLPPDDDEGDGSVAK